MEQMTPARSCRRNLIKLVPVKVLFLDGLYDIGTFGWIVDGSRGKVYAESNQSTDGDIAENPTVDTLSWDDVWISVVVGCDLDWQIKFLPFYLDGIR